MLETKNLIYCFENNMLKAKLIKSRILPERLIMTRIFFSNEVNSLKNIILNKNEFIQNKINK